jgi:hypothetical protein
MRLMSDLRRERPQTPGEATDRDVVVEVMVAAAGALLFLLYTFFVFLPAWRSVAAYLGP